MSSASVLLSQDVRDKFRAGATRALQSRAGLTSPDHANEFSGMSLLEIAGLSLTMAGESRPLSKQQLVATVMGAHTSSDFPRLLSDTAGKALREAYSAAPSTYQQIAAIGEVSDFKVHPRIQLGSFDNLQTIPEGGEYKYGSLTEEYETAQAETKGRAIKLTRQMLINDDLNAFARMSRILGRAAMRTVNVDFYTFLTSGANNRGPTGQDGGQFFNAITPSASGSGHGNLTSTGTAMSTASISLARKMMRTQKDKSVRETLGILPKTLVAPVGKEDLAWTILNSTTDVTQSNPGKKSYTADIARLNLATDPLLDDISTTAWYLFADPNDGAAAFEAVFLDGETEPYVDEIVDFDTDSMKFKVRLDYGFAIGDWRGGYKNEGA